MKNGTNAGGSKVRFTSLADTVTLGRKGELAQALAGDDTVTGQGGNDTVYGGEGNDQLSGGGGNDALYGDAGDDLLIGGAGSNILQGGTGVDTLSYSWYGTSQPLYINLAEGYAVDQAGSAGNPPAAGSGQTFNDQISGFEKVIGASLVPNIIIGDDFGNVLEGGSANDTIHGGAGADTLLGGAGSDVIEGGWGGDVIDGGAGKDYYVIRQGEERVAFEVDSYVVADGDYLIFVDPGWTLAQGNPFDFVLLGAAPEGGFNYRVDVEWSDGTTSFVFARVEGGITATVVTSEAAAAEFWL